MSDLYYYRARYYDPHTQRFISMDPIEFESGDFNHYRYVGNDPVNLVDPSGLDTEQIINGIGQLNDAKGILDDALTLKGIAENAEKHEQQVKDVCPNEDSICKEVGRLQGQAALFNETGSFLWDNLTGFAGSLAGNPFENNATKIKNPYTEEWNKYISMAKDRNTTLSQKPISKPIISPPSSGDKSNCKDWIDKVTEATPEEIDIALDDQWDYCLRHEYDNLSGE